MADYHMVRVGSEMFRNDQMFDFYSGSGGGGKIDVYQAANQAAQQGWGGSHGSYFDQRGDDFGGQFMISGERLTMPAAQAPAAPSGGGGGSSNAPLTVAPPSQGDSNNSNDISPEGDGLENTISPDETPKTPPSYLYPDRITAKFEEEEIKKTFLTKKILDEDEDGADGTFLTGSG